MVVMVQPDFPFLSAKFLFLRHICCFQNAEFWEVTLEQLLGAKCAFSKCRISVFEHRSCIFWARNFHFLSLALTSPIFLALPPTFLIPACEISEYGIELEGLDVKRWITERTVIMLILSWLYTLPCLSWLLTYYQLTSVCITSYRTACIMCIVYGN